MFLKTALTVFGLGALTLAAAAKPTVTITVTSTTTSTMTSTTTSACAATPSAIVELIAYPNPLCQANPVAKAREPPNFQHIELIDAADASPCVKITNQALSFSFAAVQLGTIPSSCGLYFYKSDSCFNDNGGAKQISIANAQNECFNLKGIGSVRVFC